MINRKVAMLRIITCAIGGVVFLLVLRDFVPIESGPIALIGAFKAPYVWNYNTQYVNTQYLLYQPFWGVVGFGAFIGLLPGIAWAIDQKSARQVFLVWSILGVVIGVILSIASRRAAPMIVFSVVGVYIGSFSALRRLGVFEAKKGDEATEQSQTSG